MARHHRLVGDCGGLHGHIEDTREAPISERRELDARDAVAQRVRHRVLLHRRQLPRDVGCGRVADGDDGFHRDAFGVHRAPRVVERIAHVPL